MTITKRVLVLYNPFAGNGKAIRMAQHAAQFVRDKHWHLVDCIGSSYAGEIETKLAASAAQDADLIILIGGDGTLRELVSGLLHQPQQPEIAFIPMGNANVVAREYDIPLNPLAALKLLDKSQTVKVDVGLVRLESKTESERQHIFLAMLEIGLGAKIVHMVNALRLGKFKRLYQLWGDLVYALAGLLAFTGRALPQVSGTYTESEAGKETLIKTSQLVVANMRTYAKGWSFTPDANSQDGLLDLVQAKNNSRLAELAGFIAAANRRKQRSKNVAYAQTRSIHLDAAEKLFMQIDGDPVVYKGPAQISIQAQAFLLHTPVTPRSSK